ncbi:LacI family DNA-binding transcriptional regulator [Clostridium sp. Marseille-P2415]|uniref:LacI family DNA-binding transcriptional regulator n=1 Tax=Clostridium sp. Marseille-P2415 TaxID=1805471 RepID=UPI0009887070|nr:LacI family DNA-binding transcriptional regulator [Clostridium sp. Marseille-P2415]
MANIKDVAKLAGVSPSTVSRALSQKIFVEEATRRRVMEAVRELDYKPSLAARSLKESKTGLLGLVIPDIQNPYYPKIVKYIEEFAYHKGYSIILCDALEQVEREKEYFTALEKLFVDGIILLPSSDSLEHIRCFTDTIPMVVINRKFDEGKINCVLGDDYDGGYTVGSYLLDQGHRKIACMMDDKKRQYNEARLDGFLRAFKERELTGYDRYLIRDVSSVEDAYQKTMVMLSGEDRPTAIFAFSDILVPGAYYAVDRSGLKIPSDISVIGYDDTIFSQYMVPPLTSFEHPAREIAQMALNLLIQEITEKEGTRRKVMKMTGRLQIRNSVCRIPYEEM